MVQMDVDLSHLKSFGAGIPEVRKRGLELTALDLIGKLMRNSPVDHGLLKQWAITKRSSDSITVQSPAKYAAAQNYGTRPYMLKPKSKKALHWGGKPGYFSKGHMMPARPGKHFVERSIEQVQPRIQNHFKVAIREVLM